MSYIVSSNQLAASGDFLMQMSHHYCILSQLASAFHQLKFQGIIRDRHTKYLLIVKVGYNYSMPNLIWEKL